MQVSPSLGQVLRQRRQERGLSQAALARRVGLTQQAIAYLEQAPPASRPHPAHLYMICDALDVSLHDMLRDSAVTTCDAEFDAFLRRRIEVAIYPSREGAAGQAIAQLSYAEQRRKRGYPHDAEQEARAVIERLTPLLDGQPEDTELALLLFEAHDLAIAAALELHRADVIGVAMRDCARMRFLAEGPLQGDPEATARVLVRLADVYMLSGLPDRLRQGWAVVNHYLTLVHEPALVLNGLRLKAALARRLGYGKEMVAIVAQIDRVVERHLIDWMIVSFVYQGLGLNLAFLSSAAKREAVRAMGMAEAAFAHARARGGHDTHVEALLLRSRAVIAATPGPGSDFVTARSCAEQGRTLAAQSQRARTLRHCEAVLQAVQEDRLLSAFPE